MNIYKLAMAERQFYPITVQDYEARTEKSEPYYQCGEDGIVRHYAICPACDNPIQVVGIVKLMESSDNPYGKHIPMNISGLAPYNQVAYDYCPLAVKNRAQPNIRERKPANDSIAEKILTILEEDFDRVVLVIREAVGIVITENLARKMLEKYIAERGHLYTRASLINIPWIFALMSDSQSLVGRVISNEKLREAILKGVPEADFKGDQLVPKSGFLSVNFCFMHHEIVPKNNTVVESMLLSVSTKKNDKITQVYKQKIEFDYERFQYLCNIPEGMGVRNQKLLSIAKEMLP